MGNVSWLKKSCRLLHWFAALSLFVLLINIQWAKAGGRPVYTITSGATSLTVRSYGTNNYGIGIQLGSAYYEQTQPCAVEVVAAGAATWISGAYSSVQDLGGGTYKCAGTQTSANGSVFTFTDTYSLSAFSIFQVSRSVVVTKANAADTGFSTRLTFAETTPSAMTDYDFFAPGVWYKDNANVADAALATNYSDNYYWFREDRLPLPLFMLRKKSTNVTFSVCHKNPDGATFTGESGLTRVIDGRMKFASIGMQNNTQPAIGILFPGSEGERTGVNGMSATAPRWAYRSNPVTTNFTQTYIMAMRLTYATDFPTALKDTWTTYYGMFNPALYSCNLNTIYLQQLGLLNNYWSSINNSSGFPFRVLLNGTVKSSRDYNWDMGFVGMQLPNAAILLREDLNAGNATMLTRDEQIVDWWANNAITASGCPKTWYDPAPQTWRTYPTYSRVVGDGMRGMLWAWNFEKKRGVNKPSWLNACYRVANWLISKQNTDGSFPRAWNFSDNTVQAAEKTNTSHLIPFLVDMYKVTGNTAFKTAAVNAGNYIYTNTFQNYQYVGGTPDNPNVPDKEAASMALRAFLALYDATGTAEWLTAATQTAYYYETWVYSWSVPIPPDDAAATYPKNRSTTGLSIIATGNNSADSYAAIDAFNFYRMYLYTGDSHLLAMSKMLLQNTKQVVNWNSADPIPGHGAPGIMQEALNVMIPRGHGVGYYLPWQTYNMMEPFTLLWDVFGAGSYDINVIDALSNKNTSNNTYSQTRNYATSNSETITNGGIYVLVNRNSGRILDVAGGSVSNSANIQQWQYLTKPSQQWKLTAVGAYYEIIAQNSNKCAGVEASSTANGANISQYTIAGTNNQLWRITGAGGGYWKVVNKNSGKVIEVANSSLVDGGNVAQNADNGTTNQQWLFMRIDQPEMPAKRIKRPRL